MVPVPGATAPGHGTCRRPQDGQSQLWHSEPQMCCFPGVSPQGVRARPPSPPRKRSFFLCGFLCFCVAFVVGTRSRCLFSDLVLVGV